MVDANLAGFWNAISDQRYRLRTAFLRSPGDPKHAGAGKDRPSALWGLSFSRRRYPFRVTLSSSSSQSPPPPTKPSPSPVVVRSPNPGSIDAASGSSPAPPTPPTVRGEVRKLVRQRRFSEAFELLDQWRGDVIGSLDADTYDSLLRACASARSAPAVRLVLRHMLEAGFEFDHRMRNRVLHSQVKSGMIEDARTLFDKMPERCIVTWGIMISGLLDVGSYEEAFSLFSEMWVDCSDAADPPLLLTMVRASAAVRDAFSGRQLHSCIVRLGFYGHEVRLSCSLIDMYSKSGCIEEARWVFDEMPERTTIAWNSIISGYALHGYAERALALYDEMQDSGVTMDQFTFSIVIKLCSRLGSVEHARQAHAGLVRNGYQLDDVSSTALVDFYSKWGRMEDARNVFDGMRQKKLNSWNALLGGYANHGMGKEAVCVFDMMRDEGVAPDHISYLAVLTACSNSGLVEEGWEIYESLAQPRAMHYARMVDLAGREDRLDTVRELIDAVPLEHSMNMWAALLTACRVHKDLELGRFAAEKLFAMEPKKLCNYMVLLNIYKSSGMSKEAAGVLESLKKNGLKLVPASTSIEIKKKPYRFLSGDTSHPRSAEIYRKLDEIMKGLARNGYTCPVEGHPQVLPDVEEQELKMVKHHSEKLAISFGILSTPDSTPLQLMQGHRICDDCHAAIKRIAAVTKRDIVIRDSSRFHHFSSGSCSCGDYW